MWKTKQKRIKLSTTYTQVDNLVKSMLF